VILLRAFTGVFGALFIIGAVLTPVELDALPRLFVGVFGLFMALTASIAKDKTIDRWFGGL